MSPAVSAPRVLVCGDRLWGNVEFVSRGSNASLESIKRRMSEYMMVGYALADYPPGTVVIEGEAPGADSIGREWAEHFGFEVIPFPADWRLGKVGGIDRNQRQLMQGRPTECLAFHHDLRLSTGTIDMVRRCRLAQIPVKVIGIRDWHPNKLLLRDADDRVLSAA